MRVTVDNKKNRSVAEANERFFLIPANPTGFKSLAKM